MKCNLGCIGSRRGNRAGYVGDGAASCSACGHWPTASQQHVLAAVLRPQVTADAAEIGDVGGTHSRRWCLSRWWWWAAPPRVAGPGFGAPGAGT
eukprot:scaffold4766_cov390-Prasinococcus_capsulatus_cf.AAC.3